VIIDYHLMKSVSVLNGWYEVERAVKLNYVFLLGVDSLFSVLAVSQCLVMAVNPRLQYLAMF